MHCHPIIEGGFWRAGVLAGTAQKPALTFHLPGLQMPRIPADALV